LLIYGSYLGGTLATSLALTESHVSRSALTNIHGLIVQNGIFDWTSVATTKDPLLTSTLPNPNPEAHNALLHSVSTSTPYTLQTLHTLKPALFTHPASAFDAFASPILFFRSAGLSTPSAFPGTKPSPSSATSTKLDDVAGLSLSDSEREDLLSMIGAEVESVPDEAVEVGRRSHLKFPPAGSGLKIPRSLFLYSGGAAREVVGKGKKRGVKGTEVKQQTDAMVGLLRRSVVSYEFKDRAHWDEDLDPHAASEARVRMQEVGEWEEEKAVREWMEDLD
jgi:hypothetical protein